jgi:poly(hydroxyalkanoate) depolymerase family esterase
MGALAGKLSRVVAIVAAAAGLWAPSADALPGTSFSGSYANAWGVRSYLGYVPSRYEPGVAVPLVVALHGCIESADAFRQLTRLDQLAEARNSVVVFPEQSPAASFMRCWNWFTQTQRGWGEPSLVAGITGVVAGRYTIDPKRIYVVGLSAGAAMAGVMGATYPDLYAAVGIGSGCEYDGLPCGPLGGVDPELAGRLAYGAMGARARVQPVVVFHGDRDAVIPPVNAVQIVRQWQATADWADDGADNGSIPRGPASSADGAAIGGQTYTVTSYVDGHGNELEQSWLVHGMGHAWSGGCGCEPYADPAGPDETRAMVDFFDRHPLP